MSLAYPLRRRAPVRGLLIPLLILGGVLASALSLAPTLTGTASAAATKSWVCTCTHCPGGAKCCCRPTLP